MHISKHHETLATLKSKTTTRTNIWGTVKWTSGKESTGITSAVRVRSSWSRAANMWARSTWTWSHKNQFFGTFHFHVIKITEPYQILLLSRNVKTTTIPVFGARETRKLPFVLFCPGQGVHLCIICSVHDPKSNKHYSQSQIYHWYYNFIQATTRCYLPS